MRKPTIWMVCKNTMVQIISILFGYMYLDGRISLVSKSKISHGVQRRMISVENFFVFFEIIIFCFVVAICDLVHAVNATYGLPEALTASGNLF